ncbi:MAG: class I SAM-dependent methyltransferase [Desulfobacterales bacterium]|jgi:ubiquinone/menaquinone biosynthesis C-methylase UbiE
MSSHHEFHHLSYKQHASHFDKERYIEGQKEPLSKAWLAQDTVSAWREDRMYKALDPIIETEPDAKWLTVGDGIYGKDAKYIFDKGCDVLATDISDKLLKEAKDIGYINKFQKENAESLSFEDQEFDYVFCKESYHHFPRPYIALYEMLRVASKGVILIEPNDQYIASSFTEILFRNMIDVFRGVFVGKVHKHAFEECGNYLYRISRRELEKVALGMNYRIVGFKGISDYYQIGSEYEKLSEKGRLYNKIKSRIYLLDALAKLNLRDYRILAAIIFKHEPSDALKQNLKKGEYDIINLPKNPYITR